ncbi:MAG: hypothetical protein DRI69_09550 [Bacteroidetes bacterium]|nr:MAG: hypothetical protein DRI69_09550 [Bacteroidota bacterium]
MKQLGIRYGLFAGGFYVVVGLINYMFELSTQGSMAGVLLWLVPFAVTFAIVYIAIKEFREENGSLTTGEGVKLGVLIGLVAALLASVFTVIYTQLIDPNVMTDQLAAVVETWEDQGMGDDEIEQALKFTEPFMTLTFAIPATIISYVIGGLIKGSISGAVLKQEAAV